MKCPRCENTLLLERERDGIQVDGCPTCRGVWLDRGELERLIARALAEEEALVGERGDRHRDRQDEDRDGQARHDHKHEKDHHGRDHDHHESGWRREHHGDDDKRRPGEHDRRPRRWFESLSDIFG